MRRTVPVLAATTGVLALLASFHTNPTTGVAASNSSGVRPGTEPGSTEPAPTDLPAPTEPSPRATGSRAGKTPHPSATTGSTAGTAASRAAPTTVSAASSVDGPVVATNYGPVQVRVTLRGTQIAEVQALRLPSDRARSQRISAMAGPKLRAEALKAQSAQIDTISGATYTSGGYKQSLQAALDSAHP
ncbi:MAG: FMN-binding protein [Acidimicrobiales bacterium]